MQTDYADRPSQRIDREIVMEEDPPVPLSRLAPVMRRYWPAMIISVSGVILAYLVVAISIYLFGSSVRVTTQPFRVGFEGADKGEYPNRTKFNIADIINGPILTRVWRENHLGDYVGFGEFSRSVFVLEANREFEQLAAEYQAKLADPKLSPVDRDRLQKEFEEKTHSIAKNEYSISISRPIGTTSIPEPLARKVLLEILNDWADFAVNRQHVIAYEVSVLSPEVLKPSAIEQNDVVAAVEVLRLKTYRVITNIDKIRKLPGATLARTSEDHISLDEVRIRLDEIARFRLEPLLAVVIHSPNLITDRAATIRFLESQLSYDQRQLDAAQRVADSIRESIAIYDQPGTTESLKNMPAKTAEGVKSGEAVMPQLSDTFLDRLMTLTGRAADAKYRQDVIQGYRTAVVDTIPERQSVAYDTLVLEELRKPPDRSSLTATAVKAQISDTRTEIGQLIIKMNELFQLVSRNMTPSTQLFTLTSPPTTRTLRAASASRLLLYGALVLLLSFPTIVALCLMHNRIREEEAADGYPPEDRNLAGAETLP